MSYGIDVKHIFLSFAQELFKENNFLTWTLDPKLTKIIIGDEYFITNPIIEKFPAIIVKRSSIRWGMHAIDQRMSLSMSTGDKRFADLLYGNITYNVMSVNAQTAGRLADYLFENITGHRDQFRYKNVNKLTGISMGEEIVIKGPTNVELVNVPINIGYVYNKELSLTHDLTDLSISSVGLDKNAVLGSRSSGDFNKGFYSEFIDYSVSGQEVLFETIPSGVELTFSYIGNTTLTQYNETVSFEAGDEDSYILSEIPRYYFETFNDTTLSGLEV